MAGDAGAPGERGDRRAAAPLTGPGAPPRLARLARLALWVLAVGAFGLGVFRAFWRVANHDVAWLLYEARRVLDGATLYKEIPEINVPLTVWVSMPAAAVARATGLQDTSLFQAGVLVLGVASLAAALWLVPAATPAAPPATARAWAAAGLGAAFFVIPAYSFAQREHLLVLLATPYLIAAAVRGRGARLPRLSLIAVGAAAGVGFALKPQFVPAWLAVESVLLWRDQARRSWRRPEALACAAVIALSVLAIPVLTPRYFDVVRSAIPVYGTYGWLPASARVRLGGFTAAAAALALAIASVRVSDAVRILATAVAALLAIAFLEGKAWAYHYLAADALAVVLVAVALLELPRSAHAAPLRLAMAAYLCVVLVAAARETLVTEPPGGRPGSARYEFETLVRARAVDGSIALFSNGFRVVFPMVNRTGVRWALSFPSLLPLPAITMRAAGRVGPGREAVVARDPAGRALINAVVTDLLRDPPALLFVDAGPSQPVAYVPFFSQDPRFASLIAGYDTLPSIGTYRVFERRHR